VTAVVAEGGERTLVSSGHDRHTGNRTRWRSDTSIFRGSFSPVHTLLHPYSHTPQRARPARFVFKTVYPKLNRAFLSFPRTASQLAPVRHPRGTQSFQKPSRRTEMHATSHCLFAGVVSFSFPVCYFPFISRTTLLFD